MATFKIVTKKGGGTEWEGAEGVRQKKKIDMLAAAQEEQDIAAEKRRSAELDRNRALDEAAQIASEKRRQEAQDAADALRRQRDADEEANRVRKQETEDRGKRVAMLEEAKKSRVQDVGQDIASKWMGAPQSPYAHENRLHADKRVVDMFEKAGGVPGTIVANQDIQANQDAEFERHRKVQLDEENKRRYEEGRDDKQTAAVLKTLKDLQKEKDRVEDRKNKAKGKKDESIWKLRAEINDIEGKVKKSGVLADSAGKAAKQKVLDAGGSPEQADAAYYAAADKHKKDIELAGGLETKKRQLDEYTGKADVEWVSNKVGSDTSAILNLPDNTPAEKQAKMDALLDWVRSQGHVSEKNADGKPGKLDDAEVAAVKNYLEYLGFKGVSNSRTAEPPPPPATEGSSRSQTSLDMGPYQNEDQSRPTPNAMTGDEVAAMDRRIVAGRQSEMRGEKELAYEKEQRRLDQEELEHKTAADFASRGKPLKWVGDIGREYAGEIPKFTEQVKKDVQSVVGAAHKAVDVWDAYTEWLQMSPERTAELERLNQERLSESEKKRQKENLEYFYKYEYPKLQKQREEARQHSARVEAEEYRKKKTLFPTKGR